ncbi:hypothetical protein I3W98_02930 [Streptomyces cavourensis]|nr:hypothetical protein [Streptomyces cavourensis]
MNPSNAAAGCSPASLDARCAAGGSDSGVPLRGHLLLLGPGGGGRRRPGPLDQGPERTVADGALEQAHPCRTDDIGPAGGRRPEEAVGLRGVTVLVAQPLPVPAVRVPPEGRTLPPVLVVRMILVLRAVLVAVVLLLALAVVRVHPHLP